MIGFLPGDKPTERNFNLWLGPVDLLGSVQMWNGIIASGISNSGRTIVLLASDKFWVFQLPTESDPSQQRISHFDVPLQGAPLVCVAVHDMTVAVASTTSMSLFSVATKKIIKTWEARDGDFHRLAFHKEGDRLFAISSGKTDEFAELFSISTMSRTFIGKWRLHIPLDLEALLVRTSAMCISDDGTKLAVCSHHLDGYAAVRLSYQKPDGKWDRVSLRPIQVHDVNSDKLGFTGISL